MPTEPPSPINGFHDKHVQLLIDSYERFVGLPLLEVTQSNLGSAVFQAPFALLSHDTSEDPIFNYANQTGLELFELTWDALIRLPSRTSAEPMNRAERQRLLDAVTRQNYIDDYSGVRISSRGRRFFIPKAIVWNVIDADGVYHGQAATFDSWEFL